MTYTIWIIHIFNSITATSNWNSSLLEVAFFVYICFSKVDRFQFQNHFIFLKIHHFHLIYFHHITILYSSIMTEPNLVRSKRQRIEEGTAGSFFGPLPKRYSKFYVFILRCDALRSIYNALSSIHTALSLISIQIQLLAYLL